MLHIPQKLAFTKIRTALPVALVAGFALCTCAAAGQANAPVHDAARFFTYENDSYFNTDRYYTNGIAFSVKRSTDTRSALARVWTQRLCGALGCEDASLLTSESSIGQLMYTPSNIRLREPQPLDRPWAGLLYYEQAYAFLSPDRRTLTTLATQAGLTGRASLSAQTQKLVHRLRDRPIPQGWDNQVGGSLGLMASAERRTALSALSVDLGNQVELNTASYWRLAVGNIMTYAAGGVAVVVGKDLPPVSAAPPGIGNKLGRETLRETSCMAPWLQCTAFGSVETRLMGYNVFLDGRVFRDDPQVRRRNLVADLVLGMRFDFPHTGNASHGPWFVQFKVTRRSPEFRSSIPVPHHRVAALTFGTEF
jgi:lipid A 3-O-deacylase